MHDEAERISRLRQGQDSIKAIEWLREYGGLVAFQIVCRGASACEGHKDAIAYLQREMDNHLPGMIEHARQQAQRDMDRVAGI